MKENRNCPKCGAAMIGDAMDGLCPKCVAGAMIGLVEASETVVVSIPVTEKPGDQIGRYKLLEQIGEGGCGVVYMAQQEEPIRRKVALKIIKLGMDTKQVVARFEAERQALAMMEHPNIAKVYDAGATEAGRPYFVMELVRGIRITEYCDRNNLSTHERLALFTLVCHAIQHAHQKGIIHRDIKPSNVLVTMHDGVPVPKVIDFGIAKSTTGQQLSDKTLFTAFAQFIGTPAYMSPEQAELSGLDIDTRSDIYSLGMLLYELLTGQTPFDSKRLYEAGIDEIRRIIREEEPPRPSTRLSSLSAAEQTTIAKQRQAEVPKLIHLVRRDLDWIVMKSLEKDRTLRYDTANDLAADIQRFLNDEPILARPPGAFYRFQKMVRRNKLAVGAASTVLVTIILGLIISTWMFLKEREARQRALAAEKVQTRLREEADSARTEVVQQKTEVEKQKAQADRKNTELHAMLAEAARSDRLVAEEKFLLGREQEAFAYLARACDYDPLSATLSAEKAIAALNAWNHTLPAMIITGHKGRVYRARFNGDSTRIVTASQDMTARVWDAGNGRLLTTLSGNKNGAVIDAQFSPDGTRVITLCDKTARVWDAITGKLVTSLVGHQGRLTGARFNSDGTCVITAAHDNTARVWETVTGKLLGALAGHEKQITSVEFSPDEKRVLTASWDKTARIWDAAAGKVLTTLTGHDGAVMNAQFSPNGSLVVTASWDKTARIWNAATGKMLTRLAGHDAGVMDAQFSPDGFRIVTASDDKTARVWDAATGNLRTTLNGHEDRVSSAQFSPDGKLILTTSDDKTARIWDAANGQILATLAGHQDRVTSAQFSADGTRVLTASEDKTARVWNCFVRKGIVVPSRYTGAPVSLQFSPDGARIATTVGDSVQIWNAINGEALTQLNGHKAVVRNVHFSPDGKSVVTASYDTTARIWDAATGQTVATLTGHEKAVNTARFSSRGTRVVTASDDKTARVWDAVTGKPLITLAGHEDGVSIARFSPEDMHIVTVSTNTARLWDANMGQIRAVLRHTSWISGAEFSPDGRRIITTSGDTTTRIWDAATGNVLANFGPAKSVSITSAEFSPKGDRIVTGSLIKTAGVWDAVTGKALATLIGHDKWVRSAVFSPDGNRIVTASDDKTARLWDAMSGKLIATLRGHTGFVLTALFSADGKRIATASDDQTARVWKVCSPCTDTPPDWFPDFLRYMAQMRLNSDGELETLKTADWLALRERLQRVLHSATNAETTYLPILRQYIHE